MILTIMHISTIYYVFLGVTMHNYDRNPQEAWVLAVEGYYEIIDRLKKRFPHLWFESCSS